MATAHQPAHVEVDCRRRLGPVQRIWASFGYDELNWTATPRGRQNLAMLGAMMETPYTVRAHNLFGPSSGWYGLRASDKTHHALHIGLGGAHYPNPLAVAKHHDAMREFEHLRHVVANQDD